MPFQSRESLAAWLAEFDAPSRPGVLAPRVIEQDGSQGADTGLVVVQLSSAVDVYIQPEMQGGTHWVVTIGSREEAHDLTSAQIATLAEEFAAVAELCAFLEEKSAATE